jgi:GntR family phosphonate transport system transcriptional regulator
MTPDRVRHTASLHRSGIAVWRQIAETLSADIRDERFPDGRLPSETDLSARFAVNRHTLRQAIHALQDEGLVRVERGRGMFVQRELLDYPLSRRTRFTENLQRQGLLPTQQLLTAHAEHAGERVARELRLAPGARVLKIENLSEANGQPVSVMTAWYPAERFDGLLEMLQEGPPPARSCSAWAWRTTCARKAASPRRCPARRPLACCASRPAAPCCAWPAWTRTSPAARSSTARPCSAATACS